MIKILNKYKCSEEEKRLAINIMRPSALGNPYVIGQHGTREEVIEQYRPYLIESIKLRYPEIIKALRQIKSDSSLLCCCPDSKPVCHGYVIKEIMDEILQYPTFEEGLEEFIKKRSLDYHSSIEIVEESLFDSKEVDAIVNTVNCIGVMGTGVAAEFKARYMENFIAYQQACKAKKLKPGEIFVFDLGEGYKPRYIFNLATKDHWKDNSKMEYINDGLISLIAMCTKYNVKVINIPKIGCGNGGLIWDDVYALMLEKISWIQSIKFRVCTLENSRPIDHAIKDGLTHINIGYKAKTELGRLLSNFSHSPFIVPEINETFQSIEGYWYWLATGCQHHILKQLWGYSAKETGKKYPSIIIPDFYDRVKTALRLKVQQNKDIRNLLYFSELPFDHYYVFGQPGHDVIRIPPSSEWLSQEWELIRQEEKAKGFKLIIAGSRDFEDYDVLREAYFNLGFEPSEIISGTARGVDRLGERLSLEVLGKEAIKFPADWDRYGKYEAGKIRNQQMADYADGLLAIWQNYSNGTKDMIERANKNKLLTQVVEM